MQTRVRIVSWFIWLIARIIGNGSTYVNLNGHGQHGSVLREYEHAAVACDSAICSKVGSDILARGGSAVDAAIAALICNGAVNMHSMGIGGGFFMLIYDRKRRNGKRWKTLNAREVAPRGSTKNMFVDDDSASTVGGKAIAVPGEIRGYRAAHAEYGRLPWAELFTPTIELCETGVAATRSLAKAVNHSRKYIQQMPGLRELFTKKDGSLIQEGDVIINRKLGRTLRRIARGGDRQFYRGSLSRDILRDIKDAGGIITAKDLRNYQVKWAPPVTATLQNGGVTGEKLTVNAMGLPSGGPVYASILNTLDRYNFNRSSVYYLKDAVLTYHRILESFKYAFARRSELGDNDELQKVLDDIISEKYADDIREKIDDTKTYPARHYMPKFSFSEGIGTAHLSVYAPDGSAVSVTSTINLYFGSKVRGERTGIIFNNEMDDFSTPKKSNAFGLPPSPSNFIRPGKRPQSSMSPSIITNSRTGDVILISGASGGPKIITANAWVTMNNLWFGQDLNDAITESRIHHQLAPNVMQYEASVHPGIIAGLKEKGHNGTLTTSIGIVQAIRVLFRGPWLSIRACCDSRKGGLPSGF